MNHDPTAHETDARLRAALTPDEATQRRVATAALRAAAGGPTPRRRIWQVACLCAAAALVAFAIRTWPWHSPAPTPAPAPASTSLTFVSRGSLIVVDSHDGRRWIVGPSTEPPGQGGYVIAIWK